MFDLFLRTVNCPRHVLHTHGSFRPLTRGEVKLGHCSPSGHSHGILFSSPAAGRYATFEIVRLFFISNEFRVSTQEILMTNERSRITHAHYILLLFMNIIVHRNVHFLWCAKNKRHGGGGGHGSVAATDNGRRWGPAARIVCVLAVQHRKPMHRILPLSPCRPLWSSFA